MTIKCCIVGASGYTGMELASLLVNHSEFDLDALYVSQNSADAGKLLEELNGSLQQFEFSDLPLTPLALEQFSDLNDKLDAVFLATPHQLSHDVLAVLDTKKLKIFDLSGAFRIADKQVFARNYGFEHLQEDALAEAVYGLAEWNASEIAEASLIAVPGCYPTASLLALKPLANAGLLESTSLPVINATSGVSGAGRKATLNNSLCEVSLQAYGVLNHRHQPEIAAHLGHHVIFTPHLGNFKRGILATITAKLTSSATPEKIQQAYEQAYSSSSVVKLVSAWPKLDDVVNSPRCHLHWQYSEDIQHIVVSSAIDNLLKGAASQAVQCANLAFGFSPSQGLEAL